MDLQTKRLLSSSFITLCLFAQSQAAYADTPQGMDKCYGIAKAGQNDCDPSAATCDKSVIDGDPNYYLYVPKGMCDKLVGGMTMFGDSNSSSVFGNTPTTPLTAPTVPVIPAPSDGTQPQSVPAPAMTAPATAPKGASMGTGTTMNSGTSTKTGVTGN